MMRYLIELYANMDLAQLAALVDVALLPFVDVELLPSLRISAVDVGYASLGERLLPLDSPSLVELFPQMSSQSWQC